MIYITGDTHGEKNRILKLGLKKDDVLIVLGDFGFLWEGSLKERRLLNKLGELPFYVCFLDGHHDNHERLSLAPETYWRGGRVHRIHKHLLHLMRGQVFWIDGISLFAFGGGRSTDADFRVPQGSWWEQEEPTDEEFSEGLHNLREWNDSVDIILTHEPPGKIMSARRFRLNQTEDAYPLSDYLEEISRTASYKQWFFGSLHEDQAYTGRHRAVFLDVIHLDPEKYANKEEKPAAIMTAE